MSGPALTPASLRQRATWLRLDKINNPYSGVFDMAADTIEQLEAEVARLTPPAHERYVRFSTELAEQMRDWSGPVRLKVEEGPDGFLALTAKYVSALPTPEATK